MKKAQTIVHYNIDTFHGNFFSMQENAEFTKWRDLT